MDPYACYCWFFFMEIHEITRFSMVGTLCILFERYDLMHHVIVFVKDESNNLMVMATTLHSTISYHPLKFQWFYEGMCFDHIKLISMLQMIRRYVIFSVGAFMKKPSCALVGGLFLFKRLYVILNPCAHPLA